MVLARLSAVFERFAIVAVFVLASAGCLSDPATPCGVGFCAGGKVCDAVHGGCVDPEQIDSCAGAAADSPCTAPGIDDGACFDGVCFPVGCGNNFVEPELGEVCDDGNNLFGDGCSADCVSDETCGNNVIDDAQGEACDDGKHCQSVCDDGTPCDSDSDCAGIGGETCAAGAACTDDAECAGIGDSMCAARNADGCQANCVLPTCGDGFVDAFENCDDGAANSDEADGACRTDCQPQRCGDGIEDTGEVCDDGNLILGDGCTSDCQSDEVCGNGVVDFHLDELCDDASPQLSHDGCGSLCVPDRATWSEALATLPGGRRNHGIAYDAARGRLVLFGGDVSNTEALGDTWEWTGDTWIEVTPAGASPPPRSGHRMVYDPNSRRVLLFGGIIGARLNDLWSWDGQSWRELTTAGDAPPPRTLHSMAYDSARDQLVVFGGQGGVGPQGLTLADTWIWDGQAWDEVEAPGPPGRFEHRMVYDTRRDEIVLFGGATSTLGSGLGDTWIWDGASWTEAEVSGPPARRGHAMAYDTLRSRVVLVNGRSGGLLNPGFFSDTWTWNGVAWSLFLNGSAPTERADADAAYDIERDRVVVFGGNDDGVASRLDDTWTLAGFTWSEPTISTAEPGPRFGHAVAYDVARDRLVLFGGTDGNARNDETWEHDGTRWISVTPATGAPSPRNGHAMAYDAARGQIVLFGGTDDTGDVDDTWIWDGLDWTPLTPDTTPPVRSSHQVVYDAARQQVVMFGGFNQASGRDDTWVWDGDDWTDVSPEGSPPARAVHAMTYDAARDRVVLFGGGTSKGASVLVADTWEWDGVSWIEIATPVAPPLRIGHQLAYDATRQAVVLFGGGTGNVGRADLWEYDGSSWTELDVVGPPARTRFAMEFDPVRTRLLLIGGQDSDGAIGDISALRRQRDGDPGESCELGAVDYDGDGVLGCDDPDCWGRCLPECPPNSTPDWPNDCDTALPHCGDGICNPDLETRRLCPGDCGAPLAICGDFICEGTEDNASCPGDCPS